MTWLFGATIFLSAALAFLVEPLVAKMLLPTFGGTAAVWTTALVFFQMALLVGYAVAHLGLTRLGVRRHALLQVAIVAVALITLPIALPTAVRPPAQVPTAAWLVGVLAVVVGVPFLVLSTTGPTIQRWFAALPIRGADQPYRLYAASNAGSLIGLIAYPTLVEPNLDLVDQARWWGIGFVAFVVLTAAAAFAVRRFVTTGGAGTAAGSDVVFPATPVAAEPIAGRRRATWVVLAAVPAALLVGVTSHLSTDVAAVPLLWVVPLAVYLSTLILAYAGVAPIGWRVANVLLPPLTLLAALTFVDVVRGPVELLFAIHLATLFAAGLVLHGRLARDRPEPGRLTEYTLLVALGGALGGLAAGVLAPLVLPLPMEEQIALVAALLLRPGLGRRPSVRALAPRLVVGAVVVAAGVAIAGLDESLSPARLAAAAIATVSVVASPWPVPLAFLVAGALLGGIVVEPPALATVRTFYGSYRVVETSAGRHVLYAGTTIHGMQDRNPGEERAPRSYYYRGGPLGQILAARLADSGPVRIGAVGLGTGAIAAYGRPGDEIVFFEIDPAVVEIARDPRLFTFLADSQARVEVVVDDGRLALERVPPASYDVLVLDAFSSDAVPVHLLTTEALDLAMSRVKPGGVVAVHVSNRYLDLEAVVAAGAASLGFVSITGSHHPPADLRAVADASQWVIVARSYSHVAGLATGDDWATGHARGHAPWTDRSSDLIGALIRD